MLFVQFTATIFVLSFLAVIVGQYNTILTYDLGYQYDRLIYTSLEGFSPEERNLISNQLPTLPCVEGISYSSNLIPNSGGGYQVSELEGKESLFVSDLMTIDSSYLQLHGIELLTGVKTPILRRPDEADSLQRAVDEMIVNQQFLRKLGKTSDQLTDFKMYNQTFHICGVVKDFQTSSLTESVMPLMMCQFDPNERNRYCYLTIKLTELTSENFNRVADQFKEILPTRGIELKSYNDTLLMQYADARTLRDGVMLATLILILISIMGVIGYVANDTKRKSREIALRKIYGSTSWAVIGMQLKNLLILVMLAAMVAIPLSYFVCKTWQNEYDVKMPLHGWIFGSAALSVALIVVVCVTAQTWKIATSNPARSIKLD